VPLSDRGSGLFVGARDANADSKSDIDVGVDSGGRQDEALSGSNGALLSSFAALRLRWSDSLTRIPRPLSILRLARKMPPYFA
jgi:hypothetical protein